MEWCAPKISGYTEGMSKIVVSHNYQRLSALLRGLGDKKSVQKAVSRSIKRTLTTVRKVAAQDIRAKKLIKISATQAKQKVHAFDEARANKPVEAQYGKVWIGSKAEPLGRFYARRVVAGSSKHPMLERQDKGGGWRGVRLYRVKLNEYGAPYLKDPKRSFISQKKKGPVVFTRQGKDRLPIEKQHGPGLAELALRTGIHRRMVQTAGARYQVEFENNVRFYAAKALERAKALR